MPEYAPGTPSWVELSSPDTDAAAAFYGELFGWEATAPDTDHGGYRQFQQDGKSVGGLMGHMQDGQPTVWTTYFSVADADETTAKVKDAGGSVMVEPMDVSELGRMAVFVDPTGAVFGVWQPRAFQGAELKNAPNSLCWTEVLTRDPDRNKEFYPAVFGWGMGRAPFEGPPESYVVWENNGDQVGGMMPMTDEFFPPEIPPHWGICFEVADCDGIVARARELGATITYEGMDMPIGRLAGFVDPQGASFSVLQPVAPA
jgi:uncharacterized protein